MAEVKKEVDDDLSKHTFKHTDDHLTLAQLSLSSGRQRKPTEKGQNLLRIKKRRSHSKTNRIVYDTAGKYVSYKRTKAGTDWSRTPSEPKSSTMIRAEEVQASLEPEFPSFLKGLVRSHVASCFWMGFPGSFCVTYLPRKDTTITLEDESGAQYDIKFIADKTGLSAGWRRFSVEHKLLEGDVLVFQLVGPTKFKVYIIRANDLTEVDGALGLLNLDAHSKQITADSKEDDAEQGTVACNSTKRKHPKPLPLAIVHRKKRTGLPTSDSRHGQLAEKSENDSEDIGSEVLEGSNFYVPAAQFKEITCFEDFKILVNGLLIDSELSEHSRAKYYELCCSRNAFLHEHLLKGISCELVAGIISEIVNIADAIRACNLNTCHDDFAIWDRTLKAFELLGMNVGFLRARLQRLASMAFDSEGAMGRKKYMDARNEKARTEDQIRNIEAELAELKEISKRYCTDIETLKFKAESYELKFLEEVTAPW